MSKDLVLKDYIYKLVQNLRLPTASNDYDVARAPPTSSLFNMTMRARSTFKQMKSNKRRKMCKNNHTSKKICIAFKFFL